VVIFGLGLIPGIFGFLAWELKENWRLYRANQSPTLDPVMVGSHGEQVIQLLRPGFHSGTLPRLFSRLRHAEGSRARTLIEQIHHVQEEVRAFVVRDLLEPLATSRGWGATATVALGEVWVGTNRLRLELCCPALAAQSAWLDFENYEGELLAGFARAGWLERVDEPRRRVLTNVLAGFYKLAGVRLLRQPPHAPLLFPAGQGSYGVVVIRWEAWVALWEHDQAGEIPLPDLLPGIELLP
jgi:hypothetical protein